jgi:hypothetical protein
MVKMRSLRQLPLFHSIYPVKTLMLAMLMSVTNALCGQPFPMDTVQWTGEVNSRINLVFFGDGYRSAQLAQYRSDVERVSDYLFAETPFAEYRDYFNIVAFLISSDSSGASLDPANPVDNFFGSAYNTSGIERLLVATKSGRALEILFDQFPLYDQAILIVNHTKYGGSGGWLATTSVHESAPEIALHELGHSFGGLADEYWAGEQFASEKPNLTMESRPTQIRWKNWLNGQEVGIYAHQENPDWFRPHQNCKMRILKPNFCPVCREALTKRIQSIVHPLEDFGPPESRLVVEQDILTLNLTLLRPEPNSMLIDWRFDGSTFHNDDTLYLTPEDIDHGMHDLSVTFYDSSFFVRDQDHINNHTYSLSWDIERSISTSTVISLSNIAYQLFPNPTTEFLLVDLMSRDYTDVMYRIYDQVGRKLKYGKLPRDGKISLRGFAAGIYSLSIHIDGSWQNSGFIKL